MENSSAYHKPEFAIGDCVDHVLGGMLGWIRCGGGGEDRPAVFAVEQFAKVERPLRIVLSEYLVPVPEGSDRCGGCVLWRGRCTRGVERKNPPL